MAQTRQVFTDIRSSMNSLQHKTRNAKGNFNTVIPPTGTTSGGPPTLQMIGKKQNIKTPLHKLLTQDMMEEFQRLLGTKLSRKERYEKNKTMVEA